MTKFVSGNSNVNIFSYKKYYYLISKSIISLGKTSYLYIAAILIYIVTFFSLNHGDLPVTCAISDLLSSGHILDFYDVALSHFSIQQIAYLPSTYVLFAIWNLPLRLLRFNYPYFLRGNTFDWYSVGKGIYWSKLLPVITYILAGVVVYKILSELGIENKTKKSAVAFWITSPLAFFSQFVFGQYDIFYVILMLLGLLYILRNRLFIGSLFWGLSFTFKYFPFIVFFVIIMYWLRKSPWKIFLYTLISFIPLIIETIPYLNSPGFKSSILQGSAGLSNYSVRLFMSGPSNGVIQGSYIFILLIFLFLYAFADDLRKENSKLKIIEFSIFAVSVFAIFLPWNPQWILFPISLYALLPFLLDSNPSHIRVFAYLDVILMIFFVGLVSIEWKWNVDVNMFNVMPLFRGVNPAIAGKTISISHIFLLGGIVTDEMGKSIYYSGFVATWILGLVYYFRVRITGLKDFSDNIPENNCLSDHTIYTLSRSIIGALIYLIPAFITLFFGQRLFVITSGKIVETFGNNNVPTGEIQKGEIIEQNGFSDNYGIYQIDLLTATYHRTNLCNLNITLSDNIENTYRNKNFSCQIFPDNDYCQIKFPRIAKSQGKIYNLKFQSADSSPGNAITILFDIGDKVQNDSLFINGQFIPGTLAMRIHYS